MFVFCVQMFVLIRLIIWLDHARTDNNCSQADKDRVNYGSYQCLEDKREKVETIGGFCDLLFRDILSALIINNNIECRIKIC